jgi:WD40 repeat protein
VWDASSGVELLQLQEPTGGVFAVCFSADGRWLATATFDTLRVWDACTGNEVLRLAGIKDCIENMCFSPDSRRLAAATLDNAVCVWDTSTGAEVLRLQGHQDTVKSVCYSPDGRRLASASWDHTVRVWDVSSGSEVLRLDDHTDGVVAVWFSLDGRRLASASYDRTVRVWDASSGTCLKVHEGIAATDLRTFFLAGLVNVPWRAFRRGLDTVLEETATGQPVASFPIALAEGFSPSPSGHVWAWGVGRYLYLVTLEGLPAPSVAEPVESGRRCKPPGGHEQ